MPRMRKRRQLTTEAIPVTMIRQRWYHSSALLYSTTYTEYNLLMCLMGVLHVKPYQQFLQYMKFSVGNYSKVSAICLLPSKVKHIFKSWLLIGFSLVSSALCIDDWHSQFISELTQRWYFGSGWISRSTLSSITQTEMPRVTSPTSECESVKSRRLLLCLQGLLWEFYDG